MIAAWVRTDVDLIPVTLIFAFIDTWTISCIKA